MYDPYIMKVCKYAKNFVKVEIPEGTRKEIEAFAKKLVKAKKEEEHHRIDSRHEEKRFTTGLMGEAALELLFGIDIIDWEIAPSAYLNVPDIPGYYVGIKTVEYGKFPVIPIKNLYPQIICIVTSTAVLVCGLADINTLNSCQDDELILDPYLRSRGVKTAFVGFDKLIPIKTIDDLALYRKK